MRTSTENGHFCIVPPKDVDGQWTSARLHGNHSFQCDNNGKMIFAANIKMGQNPRRRQQGIWPAWALGQSIRRGENWPKCGDWDIMELSNGSSTNQAKLTAPSFVGIGRQAIQWRNLSNKMATHTGSIHHTDRMGNHAESHGTVDFDRKQYHTFTLLIDFSDDDYSKQSIKFQLDNKPYHAVQGDDSSDEKDRRNWERLARSAFFPILNVAVGSDLPGDPDEKTLPGLESGMTIRWVAVYKSRY
ncbi:uncharacterized protein Z520_05995 [Fonsecaea multimorphosa CBS 102226]|uniref:GH16 domain-containing protein n=1 Tax=Fonsecaea multimorphosa CBS 102226 TaxID=1442371 RepID=A0A0D2K674_9EURO|nr:uncharacterized protein Z520_05995 [Fonsecaea multimorphosa CBS 102226]KIX98694.1 hypothetical protein Z520_05995 [Fonsecaea multimorphosa CBS 102226]